MNDRLTELGALIATEIPALIDEARDQITAAIDATMEDAQESDTGKAILSLSVTAKWDLDGNAVVVSMPVNVRKKYERAANLPDPNQPGLPGVEGGAS